MGWGNKPHGLATHVKIVTDFIYNGIQRNFSEGKQSIIIADLAVLAINTLHIATTKKNVADSGLPCNCRFLTLMNAD
jgi:hypothetical protein